MGADIKKLKNRMKSVDSTMHLTKAMGLVASSKIRKANDASVKSKQYASSFQKVIKELSMSVECSKSPFMQQRQGNRMRLIVISGDRGLAGGYNANIFRFIKQYEDAEIIPVGKRACDKFTGKLISAEKCDFSEIQQLSEALCRDFIEKKYDKLGIVSTEYISMMQQEPRIDWLLPVKKAHENQSHSMLFEPDEITVFNSAINDYVAGMIMARIKESFASEVAARRMAMDSAQKNAQSMMNSLKLSYNRARQSAITQEITEIVAGSGN